MLLFKETDRTEGNSHDTTISTLYSRLLPDGPISCQPHQDLSNHVCVCVHVHACVPASTFVCVCVLECMVCQLSSNFLSTCARLNCFLCVIDLHVMGTPLFSLWLSVLLFISSLLVYTCDSRNKA